ncbi:hypothetical protein B0H14DRAFT_3883447 [Mycena olivaceomarginata]|nr:hypothetical protein B0H14DRAFT_3883447 [Mycena olivaceomarginata]
MPKKNSCSPRAAVIDESDNEGTAQEAKPGPSQTSSIRGNVSETDYDDHPDGSEMHNDDVDMEDHDETESVVPPPPPPKKHKAPLGAGRVWVITAGAGVPSMGGALIGIVV